MKTHISTNNNGFSKYENKTKTGFTKAAKNAQ